VGILLGLSLGVATGCGRTSTDTGGSGNAGNARGTGGAGAGGAGAGGTGTGGASAGGASAGGASAGGPGTGGAGMGGAAAGAGGIECMPSAGSANLPKLTVDAGQSRPNDGSWSMGYWTWAPSYDAHTRGTEDLVAALAPPLIRIGGYNNDANVPDPFDHDELARAVQYARATGSELILQVPLLFNEAGERPTPEEGAALIAHANLTMGYGIRYVTIGNEPDLYPDQGALSNPSAPAILDYDAEQYCEEAREFSAAIEAVDPSVQFIGPELGYKYRDFVEDWLTPILARCGDIWDIVSVHRYPHESLAVTPEMAAGDMVVFRNGISEVRERMVNAGVGDKPLAVTEANLAYVASGTGNPSGSILGTMTHALWIADFVNTAADLGLWTASLYDIADPDEFKLGIIGPAPARSLRPAYHALALAATPQGPTLLTTTHSVPGLRAYATRDALDATTQVVLVHWNQSAAAVALVIEGLDVARQELQVTLPPTSVSSVRIPDQGAPSARAYSQQQLDSGVGPIELALSCGASEGALQ
jgi:hypothetical protein